MFGEDQPTTFEPAGSPKTTSPEVQLNQLFNTVDKADKALNGRVVTRISTEDGSEVLIFNALVLTPEAQRHPDVSHAGVHPKDGPIVVTNGKMSMFLDQDKVKESSGETSTWEQMLKESVKQGDRGDAVRTIKPDEQIIWDQTFDNAVNSARHTMETDRQLALVLPQSLKTAIRIAEGLNIPPEQRTPPEYAADEPRRADVGGKEEHPADLRPATPPPPGSPFGRQN